MFKKENAAAGATAAGGCEHTSNADKVSITQKKKKRKSAAPRKCKISKCEGGLCCADCSADIVSHCERRCLNAPHLCGMTKEGGGK